MRVSARPLSGRALVFYGVGVKNDDRRVRRLVVGDVAWRWTVRQRVEPGCLTLTLFREGTRRRLVLVFRPGPERVVSNTYFDAGALMRLPDRSYLNLFEPGTVRRLLDAATGSYLPERDAEVDGWPYFDSVVDSAE